VRLTDQHDDELRQRSRHRLRLLPDSSRSSWKTECSSIGRCDAHCWPVITAKRPSLAARWRLGRRACGPSTGARRSLAYSRGVTGAQRASCGPSGIRSGMQSLWVMLRSNDSAERSGVVRALVNAQPSFVNRLRWRLRCRDHCRNVSAINVPFCGIQSFNSAIKFEKKIHYGSRNSHVFWVTQITFLPKACYYRINQLRCNRAYLDSSTACTIATSIIYTKLDYCNSLYYKLPESHLSRLQQSQNSLARTVVIAPMSPVISLPSYTVHSFHWLGSEDHWTHRIYKLMSLTYKVLATTQPPYLHKFITHLCSTSSQYSLFNQHVIRYLLL